MAAWEVCFGLLRQHGLSPPDKVQKLKNAKIKRAKDLYKEGYSKSEILRMIINEFKLDRNLESRSWPKWLSEIE